MLNKPSGNSINRSAKYSQLTLPVTRKLAMMVSSSRLTWATDEPIMIGTINFMMRCTRASPQPQRGRGVRFRRRRLGSCAASCRMPAANTA